jgi:DNA-binding XRE family transcriptional regulator
MSHNQNFLTATNPNPEFETLDVDALIAGLSDEERVAMDTMTNRMRADNETYAQRLADIRHATGTTQTELATTLGISQSAVASLERNNNPSISTLLRYFNALGATAELTIRYADNTTIKVNLDQLTKPVHKQLVS